MPLPLLLRLLDGIVYDRPLVAGSTDSALWTRVGRGARHSVAAAASADSLREAARQSPGVSCVRALLVELPFRSGTFDLAVAAAPPELLETPARLAFELQRVSSRYVVMVATHSAETSDAPREEASPAASAAAAFPFDRERLAGLAAGVGLKVLRFKTWSDRSAAGRRAGVPGYAGVLAEKPRR